MRPWQILGNKRAQFPWKLHPTSREKKVKGRAFTADLFREQKGSLGLSERKDVRGERVKEMVKERGEDWTHTGWERKQKRSGSVWCLLLSSGSFLSHSGHQERYIFKKNWERNMRLSALSQGRLQWGNHSTEGSWVITDASFQTDLIIRETLWRSHIPHILHTQSYNRAYLHDVSAWTKL